jgi:hypothetical protein
MLKMSLFSASWRATGLPTSLRDGLESSIRILLLAFGLSQSSTNDKKQNVALEDTLDSCPSIAQRSTRCTRLPVS